MIIFIYLNEMEISGGPSACTCCCLPPPVAETEHVLRLARTLVELHLLVLTRFFRFLRKRSLPRHLLLLIKLSLVRFLRPNIFFIISLISTKKQTFVLYHRRWPRHHLILPFWWRSLGSDVWCL